MPSTYTSAGCQLTKRNAKGVPYSLFLAESRPKDFMLNLK